MLENPICHTNYSALFQCILYCVIIYDLKPHLKTFWISDNINQIIEDEIENIDNIYSYGFNEPSLVFLAGHKLKKIEPEIMLERAFHSRRNLFILTEDNIEDFINLNNKDIGMEKIKSFSGFNYSQGKNINFFVYKN